MLAAEQNLVTSSSPSSSNGASRFSMNKSSPWGNVTVPAVPCSLEDVMSEQLAHDLEAKDVVSIVSSDVPQSTLLEEAQVSFAAAQPEINLSDAELAAKLAVEDGYDPNDELIARYLQREYDKEHDAMLDKVAEKYNGSSKVSISFDKYKMKTLRSEDKPKNEIDEDSDSYEEEFPEFPKPTNWEGNKMSLGPKGYTYQGKNIVTKHDKVVCGRRNAERLMEFPPEFYSGDGEGMDMQLPNKVYNSLKTHSRAENKKSHKVHEKKDHSTAIKAVDEKTRMLMFKMVNSGFLASIDGVVSEGKEAVVFQAVGGMKDEKELPKGVILKVYKTTMNEFHTRSKYVQGDHRLSKDIFKKQNPRKIMQLWAEKEFLNLKKMCRHKIPCPTPLALKKHVLAMTCVGGEHPAPKLKDVRLSVEDMQDAYEQTVEVLKQLYSQCGLVHADLSEYNILWHDSSVWLIDVSQSVERQHPLAQDFLLRDCQNICAFFKQAGVHEVPSAETLFMDVTSYSLEGEGSVFAAQVKKYDKEEYSFDFFFNQSESSRAQGLREESSSSDSELEEEENDVTRNRKEEENVEKKADDSAKSEDINENEPQMNVETQRWEVHSDDSS